MDTNVVITLILSITSIVVSIICIYKPRARKQEIVSLKKELLQLYKDVQGLKQIEENFEDQFGVSKKTARKNIEISHLQESKKIKSRISSLKKDLNILDEK